jgi:hypothetical protein
MLLVCPKEAEPPGQRSQPEAGNEGKLIINRQDAESAKREEGVAHGKMPFQATTDRAFTLV